MTKLRDLLESDREMLRNWRNQPDIRRNMYTDHVISPEEHERWFARISCDSTRRYWIINSDGQDVGLGMLSDITPRHRRCSYASYLAVPGLRGKGIGSAAEFYILEYAFGALDLLKVCCVVLAFNMPGTDVHKRFGFIEEGLLRRHVLKEEGPVDVLCLALFREDWQNRRGEIEQRLKSRGYIE